MNAPKRKKWMRLPDYKVPDFYYEESRSNAYGREYSAPGAGWEHQAQVIDNKVYSSAAQLETDNPADVCPIPSWMTAQTSSGVGLSMTNANSLAQIYKYLNKLSLAAQVSQGKP